MAGNTVDMSKIKQVIQLSETGKSNRSIAKDLGIDKETVNNYVNFFRSDTLSLKELLNMEDPELKSRFKTRANCWTCQKQ